MELEPESAGKAALKILDALPQADSKRGTSFAKTDVKWTDSAGKRWGLIMQDGQLKKYPR